MMKLNGWLETLGVNATRLGMFQQEHPELPGSGCVRTWSNNGAADGKLWMPIREQAAKRNILCEEGKDSIQIGVEFLRKRLHCPFKHIGPDSARADDIAADSGGSKVQRDLPR